MGRLRGRVRTLEARLRGRRMAAEPAEVWTVVPPELGGDGTPVLLSAMDTELLDRLIASLGGGPPEHQYLGEDITR